MSVVDFSRYVKYDEESPSYLTWLVTIYNNAGVPMTQEGRHIECLNKSTKYYVFKLNGVQYLAHRVIMVLFGYELKDSFVDHINGDRSFNKIENLRLISRLDNTKNCKKYSTNKSGYTGIHFNKEDNSFRATWSVDGKSFSKSFSVLKYGNDMALDLAINFREEKLKEIGGYSERHGT